MGYTRYPSSGGSGISTYPNEASLPSASDGAMALTTDTHTLWVYDGGLASWMPLCDESTIVGVSGFNNYRAARVNLSAGVYYAVVYFTAALADDDYALDFSIENTVDTRPVFLNPVVTGRFAYGFTVLFNAQTDTANYKLHYKATKTSPSVAGRASISNGASTVSVTFSPALSSSNYALDLSFENTTDTSPIFMQAVITARSTSGFTATLNAAADTANYVLHYTVRGDQ